MNAGLFSTVLLRTDLFDRPTQQKTQEEVEDSEALLAKNAVQMSLEVKGILLLQTWVARWWFQTFFIFIPTWGNDPI